MKLPLRLAGIGVFKALDGVLTLAIKVDEWLRERAQREPKGMTHKDAARISAASNAAGRCPQCGNVHPSNIACADALREVRSRTTVIIPRPKP